MSDSRIPGFYRLNLSQRQSALQARFDLNTTELEILAQGNALDWARADKMIENCVGVLGLPVGLGLNFLINGQDYVVPMVVEEPSIIAAVSHIARLLRPHGGFEAESDPSLMIAQVQLVGAPQPKQAMELLQAAEPELLKRANAVHPKYARSWGGGSGDRAAAL